MHFYRGACDTHSYSTHRASNKKKNAFKRI